MDQLEEADSFAAWRRLISSTLVPFAAEQVRPGPFTGRIGGRTLQDVGIMRLDAGAQTVLRSPVLFARAAPRARTAAT